MTTQIPATKLRMTRQRRVILDLVRRAGSHPSADEVYETVRQQLPHISLGTVYRTLSTLSEFDLIRELQLTGEVKRFDRDLTPHYHVRCTACGEISDLAFAPAQPLDEAVRGLTDYAIIGHHLEFVGICPVCRDDVTHEAASDGDLHPTGGSAGPDSGQGPGSASSSPSGRTETCTT